MKEEFRRIGDDLRKIKKEIKFFFLLWIFKIFAAIGNFLSKAKVALRPKNLWKSLVSLRPSDFKRFYQNSKKWLIKHYP